MESGNRASIPEFGNKLDGVDYLDRPGVYAVIASKDRQIATLETRRGYFLPGGGIAGNEMETDAFMKYILFPKL